ncbi:MAG: hypothetical protein Fur0037_23880 [Planctomycetota bacterium]
MRISALLLLLAAPSCIWFTQREDVLVTSDPPGARIFVDGTDMQRTTPAKILVGGTFGHDHVLTLRKKGYRDETRVLSQFTEGYTAMWTHGAANETDPPMPIFWTAGDLFFPFGIRSSIVPGEVFVRLRGDDEPPVGFEALRAKNESDAGAGR